MVKVAYLAQYGPWAVVAVAMAACLAATADQVAAVAILQMEHTTTEILVSGAVSA
jgi:hypothetical protein